MVQKYDHEHVLHLKQEIQAGRLEGFGLLVKDFQSYVYQIAFKIIRTQEEAEEVTQDVFLKVYQKLPFFKGESKFSTWIYAIAHNLALNRLAQLNRRVENERSWVMEQNGEELTVDWKDLEWKDRRKFIDQAIECLGQDDQLVVTLFYMHEQQLPEIAIIMDSNVNAVKVKLHRARKKLESALRGILQNELRTL